MPLYPFRCPECGLEFAVARPMSRSGEAAFCPVDETAGERIFTSPMTFIKGDPSAMAAQSAPKPAGGGSGWSHFGHSHGSGSGGHSHGGRGPSALPEPPAST